MMMMMKFLLSSLRVKCRTRATNTADLYGEAHQIGKADVVATVVHEEVSKIAISHQLSDNKHLGIIFGTDAIQLDYVRMIERRHHTNLLEK